MSGIMSMFSNLMGGAPATSAQPAANPQPQPGNLPVNTATTGATSTGAAPNGTLPAAGTDTKQTTPLDQFNDLWKNDATGDAAKPAGVFGDVDPKKFTEAAGKIDFSKQVSPEQLQAIAAGGEQAVQAFAQAMNSVAQSVYAQSAFATTKIVEQALSKSKDSFLSELPQHIKKQNVSDSLRNENPIFSNPAVQPIIGALEAQMTMKFPNATASEITAMAKQYVEAFGAAVVPKPAEPASAKKSQETDWSTFLD